jgi:hypothetical protein
MPTRHGGGLQAGAPEQQPHTLARCACLPLPLSRARPGSGIAVCGGSDGRRPLCQSPAWWDISALREESPLQASTPIKAAWLRSGHRGGSRRHEPPGIVAAAGSRASLDAAPARTVAPTVDRGTGRETNLRPLTPACIHPGTRGEVYVRRGEASDDDAVRAAVTR